MEARDSQSESASLNELAHSAIEYLKVQLGASAPQSLDPGTVFPDSPLDGEGKTAIFPFECNHGASQDRRYFVVVGNTQPNYYPAYGLSIEEAFELHLGTRFMLVIGVAQRFPTADDDFDIQREARRVVDRIAPNIPIEDLELATSFDVDGRLHAVLRCQIAGRPVYVMAGETPPGFVEKVQLPPQVAYRMHIGHVLRNEPTPEDS